MTALEISKMSVLERLQTMEALWDSLIHEKTKRASPKAGMEKLFLKEQSRLKMAVLSSNP